MMDLIKGSCLCGDVTFQVAGTPQGASACHCGQCRKQSGHVWASASAPASRVEINGTPTWYGASKDAERGFCGRCGSFLFWKAHDEQTMSFSLGSIDGPTGLSLQKHIFVADKGDYYSLSDGLAQQQ